MKLTIYHLKTCDTCRKAIKALQAAGHDLTLIDVRADGVPAADLKRLAESVGWETLLNTRSTTWRGLEPAEKLGVNQDTALKLLAAHPTLIKRPVIDNGQDVMVGWKAETQAQYLS